jgi:sugar phosphate isomerase/epimerase
MTPHLVIPSTTSHKQEPLLPTLEIFAQLGMHDLDLNLNHIIDKGTSVEAIEHALAANRQRVWIVSGGWCDFFDGGSKARETRLSVEKQVALTRRFGVDRLRLFFGRLLYERVMPQSIADATANIRSLADAHPDLLFVFENHDGASSSPRVCREILEAVDRRNARLNFDPINFEAAGVNSLGALDVVAPLVAHVHLKGLDHQSRFCEFGQGRIDLTPVLRRLVAGGYAGGFSVEYEGPADRTLRLYQGLRTAQQTIAAIATGAPA